MLVVNPYGSPLYRDMTAQVPRLDAFFFLELNTCSDLAIRYSNILSKPNMRSFCIAQL